MYDKQDKKKKKENKTREKTQIRWKLCKSINNVKNKDKRKETKSKQKCYCWLVNFACHPDGYYCFLRKSFYNFLQKVFFLWIALSYRQCNWALITVMVLCFNQGSHWLVQQCSSESHHFRCCFWYQCLLPLSVLWIDMSEYVDQKLLWRRRHLWGDVEMAKTKVGGECSKKWLTFDVWSHWSLFFQFLSPKTKLKQ